MNRQLSLFSPETIGPRGLRYYPEIVTPSIELDLMERIRGLPLVPFQFGAYEGKRRIASFGFKYDYVERRPAVGNAIASASRFPKTNLAVFFQHNRPR